MSFDLRFVSGSGTPTPTINSLATWAESQPHITVENDGENGRLGYENGNTGVYFTLYRSPAGLDLNINYCRPAFFALETAEVMRAIVAEFLLLVIDPNDGTTTEYNPDALIESWREGNRFACAAMRSLGNNLPWMEEAKATALWHYLSDRGQIAEAYDEYFVPKVLVIRLDNQILRAAHLTRPTYYVVPPIEVFLLENRSIVWVDRVLSVLQPYLTKLEGFESFDVVSEDTCFDTDVMNVWNAMYDALTPDFNMSQIEGKALAMDGFVDVKP
jgi:hypothetical protein